MLLGLQNKKVRLLKAELIGEEYEPVPHVFLKFKDYEIKENYDGLFIETLYCNFSGGAIVEEYHGDDLPVDYDLEGHLKGHHVIRVEDCHLHFSDAQKLRNRRGRNGVDVLDQILVDIEKIEKSKIDPEANKKALHSLRDMLSEQDYRKFLKRGHIEVPGKRSTYIVRKHGKISVLKQNKEIARLCVHTTKGLPPVDHVLSMKQLIELDEQEIWKRSNVKTISII